MESLTGPDFAHFIVAGSTAGRGNPIRPDNHRTICTDLAMIETKLKKTDMETLLQTDGRLNAIITEWFFDMLMRPGGNPDNVRVRLWASPSDKRVGAIRVLRLRA